MIEIIPNYHPMFVHYTIALLTTSSFIFIFNYCFEFKYKKQLLTVARINLWIGAFMTIFTLIAGFHAYMTVPHGRMTHMFMSFHRNWALLTAIIFFGLAFWQTKYKLSDSVNFNFVVIIIFATVFLIITGYKGAELVYRYGVGVIPVEVEDASHHEHNSYNHHRY